MKQIKKSTLCLALLAVLLPVLSLLPKSRDFSLKAVSAKLPYNPEWEGRALNEEEEREVSSALSQPYRYLGKGGQCFAFVSEDGKYVIKFLKLYKFDVPSLFSNKKKTHKMCKKRHAVFSAFKSSFNQLSPETGLLFVHLNATSHLKKILQLSDRQNTLHQLDLDAIPFVLQKKADLAFDAIGSLMRNKDVLGAERAIDQLLALPWALSQKGFRNRDSNFYSNFGFVDSKAIVFDVGRIVYSEEIKKTENFKKEFSHMTPRMRHYLSSRHPELLPHFEQSVAKILQSNHKNDS